MSNVKKRVVCAMSGGVDSSVVAALLVEAGYTVIGITMNIWPSAKTTEEAERFGGCCSLSATDDAKKVAYKLNIPHYTFDFREIFKQEVIEDFVSEYRRGRTPNPCIKCNQFIKFRALLHKALALGVDCIATGHYARVEFDSSRERFILRKGIDGSKDQSYVLYVLTQDQLAHTLFPLGYLTKEQTRKKAAELGLSVAEKKESQEICFVPDKNYPKFVGEYVPGVEKPGPIYDKQGNVLGVHKGIIHYTIGQRKGLGISSPVPLYVIAIKEEEDAIVVGTKEDLGKTSLVAEDINLISVAELTESTRVKAKIRYKAPEAPATISPMPEGRIKVEFDDPQSAITPGQAVVFYDGDIVVGGGTIERSLS
ncbi:MAG TPA: tRNA 2-thiouridine(34) synthase MnmA [Anaerolineae bacterium]|jgi:tRNA-specific 2-thiouridylase|nr:tRNA 2-thiouridine(34) synthase MnmA [Anaerolineae bacterium]